MKHTDVQQPHQRVENGKMAGEVEDQDTDDGGKEGGLQTAKELGRVGTESPRDETLIDHH